MQNRVEAPDGQMANATGLCYRSPDWPNGRLWSSPAAAAAATQMRHGLQTQSIAAQGRFFARVVGKVVGVQVAGWKSRPVLRNPRHASLTMANVANHPSSPAPVPSPCIAVG